MTAPIGGWGQGQVAPATLVRTYQGKPDDAAQQAAVDAAALAASGYVEVSRIYAPGSWGCGAFLIAIALILVVGLGLLILAYLVIVKPDGTLTVTYARQVQFVAPPSYESPAFQRF